jgi:hypothetical protein
MQNVVPVALPVTVSVMVGMDAQIGVNTYRNGAKIVFKKSRYERFLNKQ